MSHVAPHLIGYPGNYRDQKDDLDGGDHAPKISHGVSRLSSHLREG
jgi:hypothetical protein